MTGYLAESWAPLGTAVSPESMVIVKAVGGVARSTERSQSLFGRKAAAISEIWALVNECDEAGWDGAGAEPVDRLAAFAAAELVRALPAGLPVPEAAAEPDGSVSLDWTCSRNRVFSVSVGANRRLAFAWIDGSDKGHGVARFDGEQVPQRVLDGINEILKHGNPAVGSR